MFISTAAIPLNSQTKKAVHHYFNNEKLLKTIMNDKFSKNITDEQKVVEFNKLLKMYNKSTSNYVIVDKKNCQAKVYTPEGKIVYKCEVALGRDIGDKRSGGYQKKNSVLRAYTTPGEFTIIREGSKNPANVKLYGQRLMPLAGDHTASDSKYSQVLAMHRVPKTPMGKLRENVFNNGTLKDNRVSYGCINFLVSSYDKLRSFISGAKTKVYILPEEKGNSLHLELQKNGTYKFFQTKYRTEDMEPKVLSKAKKNPKPDSVDSVLPEGINSQDSTKKLMKKEPQVTDSSKQENDDLNKNLIKILLNPEKSDSVNPVIKID